MKTLSLTSRIILAYTLLFGILLTVFGFAIYRSSRSAEFATIDARLERYAANIQTELGEQQESPHPDFHTLLRDIRPEFFGGARFVLLDPSGNVLVNDSLLSSLPINPAQVPRSGDDSLFSADVRTEPYRCMWARAEFEEREDYVLLVGTPMADAEDRLARLRIRLFAAIPASLLLAAIAAFFVTRSALRPIRTMASTAEALSAATLHQRVPVPKAHDEVRILAQSLNDMIGRIEAAFQSQRQFIADASHELRTPLSVLTTELEFAEQRSEGPARESITVALAEVERMTTLANSLISLARLHAPDISLSIEPLCIGDLLNECANYMRAAARRRHMTLVVEADPGILVHGDRDRLKSVFQNLFDNAIKYSPEHTCVHTIVVADFRTGTATIRVTDEGHGIAAGERARIFERFYRSPEARSQSDGSGLGLAIADRIVRLHQGSIDVESTPGKGSTFVVTLPLLSPP